MSAVALFGNALTALGQIFRLVWDAVGNILVYHPAARVAKVILHGTYTTCGGVVDMAGAAYDAYDALSA